MPKIQTYYYRCPNEECSMTLEYEIEPYDPGRISGPPEDCYPPDGGFAYAPEDCPYCHTDISKDWLEHVYEAWASEEPDYPDPPEPDWEDRDF
jgi:hypothetical protein